MALHYAISQITRAKLRMRTNLSAAIFPGMGFSDISERMKIPNSFQVQPLVLRREDKKDG